MSNDIEVKIGGDTTGLKKSLDKSKKSTNKFASSVKKAIAGIGGLMLFKSLTEGAMDFEKQMAEVNTIAQLSNSELSKLSDSVLDLSKKFGLATDDLTKGLYQALSAGVPSGNVVEFLEVASKSAIAGVTNLETAVDGLTTVINAYGLSESDAETISNTFFETIRLGKTTFEELSQNLGNVATIANAAGITFEETAAALASLTKKGLDTATATTQLKGAIKNLLAPNEDLRRLQKQLAKDLGVTTIATMPLQKQLKLIADAVGNDSQAIKKLFPDVRAMNAVLALTGENARNAAKDLEDVSDSAGATGDAFKKMADTSAMSVDKAKAKVKSLGIAIGDFLIKNIAKSIELLSEIPDVITDPSGIVGQKQKTRNSLVKKAGKVGTSGVEGASGFSQRYLMIANKIGLANENDLKYLRRKLAYLDAEVALAKKKKKAKDKELKDEKTIAKEKARDKKIQDEKDVKAEKKASKQTSDVKSVIDQIKQEISLQELKNQGLEKEAEIKKSIYDMEKKIGRKLTDKEKTDLTSVVGKNYDVSNITEANKPKELQSVQQKSAVDTDRLLRIGGSIGGGAGREGINLDKKRNDILGKIVKLYEGGEKNIGGLEAMI